MTARLSPKARKIVAYVERCDGQRKLTQLDRRFMRGRGWDRREYIDALNEAVAAGALVYDHDLERIERARR